MCGGEMASFGSINRTSAALLAQPDWINRLMIDDLRSLEPTSDAVAGADVIVGLTQTPKTLPPQYFYDDRGSQLFEQICQVPEYYLTRTEASILLQSGRAIAQETGPCELVELGSGSSAKMRLLLNVYQSLDYPLCYRPIDISAGILQSSAQQLLQDYPCLKVHALAGTYEQAFQHLTRAYLPQRMIVFLGSSLGNFSREQCDRFFDQIAQVLQPNDYFLLGIDLHKPTAPLESAYNDSQGVTAAFNLNMLSHLNHRFTGNFDVAQFAHHAFYNQPQQQIEMHLRSLSQQTVRLETLNLSVSLQAGETIRSEISRKFHLPTLQAQLETKHLPTVNIWTDENRWFAMVLCRRQP
jgi:L-histidine Nalpha-methyltransferase